MDRELAPGRNEARIVEADGCECVEIRLTRGYATIVNQNDWERIRHLRWFAHGKEPWVYAVAWKPLGGGWRNRKLLLLHRVIFDDAEAPIVDHREAKTLDNRLSELRAASDANNQANRTSRGGTSKYKGVSWVREKRRWRASIYREGRFIFLGYHLTEEDAAKAYDSASRGMDGEFSRPNLPDAA